jgi:hypothetical protein
MTETVTGNGFSMTEKIPCVVCGREGFVRFDSNPRHVAHPHGGPCMLPPNPPTIEVKGYRRVVTHVRVDAA